MVPHSTEHRVGAKERGPEGGPWRWCGGEKLTTATLLPEQLLVLVTIVINYYQLNVDNYHLNTIIINIINY